MQPRRVYPGRDRAPVVGDPRVPQQTPLLSVLKQPLHLLLSAHFQHLTARENFALETVETLQVVLLLDDALEFVVDLHVVEVQPFFEGAERVFGGLEQVVLGDK